MSPNEFGEVPNTIGCIIPQGQCVEGSYNQMEPFEIGE